MPRRLLTLACLLALALVPPALAQEPADEAAPAETKKEARAREKEERIAEYLRKKEERRVEREQRQMEQEAAAAEAAALKAQEEQEQARLDVEDEGRKIVAGAAVVAGAADAAAEPASEYADLPPKIRRAQEAVRRTRLGEDPTVVAYLDLVDQSAASPQQLAALGNFLSLANMTPVGIEYYKLAVQMDQNDVTLWANLGTMHRQLGELGPAIDAFNEALAIDITNATAHYNLGATFDQQGKYDAALQEYKVALALDPSLGDPAVNPQAANNERLMAVRLLLYQEQAGNIGLPLLEVPGGELEPATDTP